MESTIVPNELRASLASTEIFSGTGVTIIVFEGLIDSPVAIFRSKKILEIVSDSCRFEIFKTSLVSSAYAAGEMVLGALSAGGGGEGDPSVGDFLFN